MTMSFNLFFSLSFIVSLSIVCYNKRIEINADELLLRHKRVHFLRIKVMLFDYVDLRRHAVKSF